MLKDGALSSAGCQPAGRPRLPWLPPRRGGVRAGRGPGGPAGVKQRRSGRPRSSAPAPPHLALGCRPPQHWISEGIGGERQGENVTSARSAAAGGGRAHLSLPVSRRPRPLGRAQSRPPPERRRRRRVRPRT